MFKRIASAVLALFAFATMARADITDAKFSTAQIFDVQWYVDGANVLHTSGYNYLYGATNYATQTDQAARLTAAQYADINSNGRYVAFFHSTTVAGTYGLAVFNADGTTYKIIDKTGSFRALANGAIFYNGNGMWGTLITTGQGYNLGASANFSVTTNYPTTANLQAYTPLTTVPLSAGQTAAQANATVAPPAPTPPPAPTVVSTSNGTPTVTSTNTSGPSTTTTTSVAGVTTSTTSTTRGTPVVTTSFADQARKDMRIIAVTRTTTNVTTTPLTVVRTYTTPVTTTVVTHIPTITTTVTTPQIITTWSDGSTTTAAGTPVTTTTTTYADTPVMTTTDSVTVVTTYLYDIQTAQTAQTASASSVGLNDAIKVARNNPFLIDPLEPRDANWIAPRAAYYSVSSGKYVQGGISFGRQETVENNTFGVAFDASTTDSHGMLNSQNSGESYSGTMYLLSKQDYVWVKGAVGASTNTITGSSKIPEFIMTNSQKAIQNIYYGDVAVYSAEDYMGFRPFLGAKVIDSQVTKYSTVGTAMIAPNMPKKSNLEVQPYGGVRWEYDRDVGLEFRVTKTRDFKTVSGVKGYIYREIADGVSVSFTVGADKGSHYTNVYGMVGLVVKF